MQYHPRMQRLRLVPGLAALSLILAACHGGSFGTAPSLPASIQTNAQLGQLVSSCGDRLRIVLAGIVDCQFHEVGGSAKDVFTLKNDTNGLILISPTKGNRYTTFTITALLVGGGHFTVKDGKGDRLVVKVRVTL